jgi:biofilm PGA synthesis N-glycosyltransferase PgaC
LPRGNEPCAKPRIVAMVPAHNEEKNIAGTIQSLLDQTRPLDAIIIISDNSTDNTVAIARTFPVIVIESKGLPGCCPSCTEKKKNTHRKSGGLNQGWDLYARDADIIVCADGDTTFPDHAVAHWELAFARNLNLGGESSQPVLIGGEHWEVRPRDPERHLIPDRVCAYTAGVLAWYLPRLQRFEFAKTITQSLRRGFVLVVSGTGCAYRNAALHEVARHPNQHGPWTYESVVEDYHLTYQMRKAGWECRMSRTVWCYTGSMTTLKSLWYQRIKWTGGTNGDLLKFGFDRINYRQWLQNMFLLVNIAFYFVWLTLEISESLTTGFHINWWWQTLAFSLVTLELAHMSRMRHPRWRLDWKDWLLAGLMIHLYVYNVLSVAWGMVSWGKVLYSTLGDLWAPQYRAEGMTSVEEQKIGI